VLVLFQVLIVHAQDLIESEAVRQEGYYFTNPLLDCEPKLTYIPPFKKDLSELVDRFIREKSASRISVYFRQLNNGYSFGVNENMKYNPASLLKVGDAIYIMKQAEQDPELLEEEIVFEQKLGDSQAETELVIGKAYRIKDLIYYSLVHSDNEAKNYLQKRFNNKQMWKDVFTDIGIPIKTGAAFPNILSPKTYSKLFRVLYNSSYLNRKNSQILLKILSQTTFKDGIISGIDNSQVKVANKFGFRNLKDGFQLHESAIVYLNRNPYLLTVMTEGESNDDLYLILKHISQLVYTNCMADTQSSAVAGKDAGAPSMIHPLLDCSTDIEMLTPFKKKVVNAAAKLKSQGSASSISVYFKHLTTGHGFSIEADTKFSPASTMKVAHMMTILRASEGSADALDHVLSFDHDMYSRYQNIQDEMITPGEDYTVWELVKRMIIYSDNLAADLLAENILNVNEMWSALFKELGLLHVLAEKGVAQQLTVKELSLFFRVLYNATYLNRENSELALSLLTRTRFQKGIRAGVSDKNVVVASKFGERSFDGPGRSTENKELHDIGIVYLEENPYILCVMTKGTDFDKQAEAIANISEIVFKEMKDQFPVKQ